MTVASHLVLIPRDGLFCKDGRGWHTSASGRGHGLDWPWPSTILGALRTAWGRAEEIRRGSRFSRDEWPKETASISLGITVALRHTSGVPWSREHRLWPVPADALWLEGLEEVRFLDPAPPVLSTLGIDDDEAREALWVPSVEDVSKPVPAPRWWSDDDMTSWLIGDAVSSTRDKALAQPHRRLQAHVGIRPDTLTADDGALFAHDVIETLERRAEWGIGVHVEWSDGSDVEFATLGSDSRLAMIESLPAELFEPPGPLLEAFRLEPRGLRLVVVTPAEFAAGWLPDGLSRQGRELRGRIAPIAADLVLRAAMVRRPVHISGWDMAANNGRGAPKPVSRMVPPGAVYFFQRKDGRPFGEAEARALWLATMGSRSREGFGRVIPGTWFPHRSAS